MVKKKANVAKQHRRKLSPAFKAEVALAALRDDQTMASLCKHYKLSATQINDWKKQLMSRATEVFDRGAAAEPTDLAPLHAKIGQQALEIDFFTRAFNKAGLLSVRT